MSLILVIEENSQIAVLNQENETQNQGAREKKLVQINKDGKLEQKVYYESGKVGRIDFFDKGAFKNRVKMFYENNLLSKEEYYNFADEMIYYYSFKYEGNLVVRRDFFNRNYNYDSIQQKYTPYFKNTGYDIFKNRAGKFNNLIETQVYREDKFIYRYEVNYSDDLGSSTSVVYNANGEKTSVSVWTKDNKKSYFKYMDAFPYQHEHNNISKSSKDLKSNKTTGYTSILTYDNDGYPLTEKRTQSSGEVSNYEYIWE